MHSRKVLQWWRRTEDPYSYVRGPTQEICSDFVQISYSDSLSQPHFHEEKLLRAVRCPAWQFICVCNDWAGSSADLPCGGPVRRIAE